jgi:hypothetical protein
MQRTRGGKSEIQILHSSFVEKILRLGVLFLDVTVDIG